MDGATRLTDINIPHLDVVLDEIFRVPPARLFPELGQPVTVADLAARTRQTEADVVARLTEVRQMSEGIEITPAELQALLATADDKTRPVLLDVREAWEFDICHLPGSLLLTALRFDELLPQLRAAPSVVAVCHHGVRSFSAAMYLRQRGVAGALSLAGGVEAWAAEIDRGMPRY